MKQEIDFIKFNPTQNMTVLVKTDHPVELYKPIATKIMSYDNVYAEQVGFIRNGEKSGVAAQLQMSGGEFCGNACMAMAAFLASEKGLKQDDLKEIVLEVSGIDQLIRCRVKREQEEYTCQVAMPIPKKIEQKTIYYDGSDLNITIVRYSESIHIVVEVDVFSDNMRKKAESLGKLLGVTLGASLIGILLYNPNSIEMDPLIYVPHLDSMVWERGCGSGSASVGAYLAWKKKRDMMVKIRQPGGTISVTATCLEGELTSVKIEGSVSIVAQGKAYISI